MQITSLRVAQIETLQIGTRLQLPPFPHDQGTPHISKTAVGRMKQRGMAGQGVGDKEGEVKGKMATETSDFPPTVHFFK